METSIGVHTHRQSAVPNHATTGHETPVFRSMKMNMNEKELEISLRISQIFGNQFKIELENQMMTVSIVADLNQPRMASRTILLPCEVDRDTQVTERKGDVLTIRFKRDSSENYLFNWQSTGTS